ncbi:MAG TPA: TIR domain-containing protein [Beijerinckiaceae bacterium]|jgi:hypothetical protein
MELLETWTVERSDGSHAIELLLGDLTQIPPEHAIDVLVVSAFPNDYIPTRSSLIGALDRAGLSVRALARNKQADLREQYSCWLSKPVPESFPFRRVLCIESGWRGTPPEIADDLFRALAPCCLISELPSISVAMPLIGTGDQGWDPEQMLRPILAAAVSWMERGLPLRLLKIVVRGRDVAERARSAFAGMKPKQALGRAALKAANYDIFISYAREESDMALYLVQELGASAKPPSIFFDQIALQEGASWPMQIANALDASKRVVALYSPSYWTSKNCQMEFLAAFTRQNDTGAHILFPIYLQDVNIPYMFRILEYADCRISDRAKVSDACRRLVAQFAA